MEIVYRQATLDDAKAVYNVMAQANNDQNQRLGMTEEENEWADPAFVAWLWQRRQALFEFLTVKAEQFWVAEKEGEVIGYARSILGKNIRELTEFFMLPALQSQGIGRELLRRAFPNDEIERKVIMASTDTRAQALYLRHGVYPRFAIQYLYRKPEQVEVETDLTFLPVTLTENSLATMRKIDREILDLERDDEHTFLLGDRKAYFYLRDGAVVGYGYLGKGTGPIALLDETDFPAVLAHAETDAAVRGDKEFGMMVPLINHAAVDYLFNRKYRLEGFVVLFMSNKPFGKFENYIITTPDLFL